MKMLHLYNICIVLAAIDDLMVPNRKHKGKEKERKCMHYELRCERKENDVG